MAQYLEREYHPDRLLYPRRRTGAKGEGRFERISWDEALDTIASKLQRVAAEFGSEAILPYSYAGTMGLLNGSGMDQRFFHRLGASRLDRTICSTAGMAGMTEALGVRYGTEPEQFRHSKLILAWGRQRPRQQRPPLAVHRGGAAQRERSSTRSTRAGNRTGETSDKHFFINPGSDTASRAGDDARHHRGETCTTPPMSTRTTSGFDALRQRVREWTPQRAAELTGIAAEEIVALAASTPPPGPPRSA